MVYIWKLNDVIRIIPARMAERSSDCEAQQEFVISDQDRTAPALQIRHNKRQLSLANNDNRQNIK